MKRLLSIGIIFLFIGMSISSSTGFNVKEQSNTASSNGKTLYVGGSGPGNYSKIQDAINDSRDGDTVFVYNGTYYQYNITIDKEITLIGENRYTTIIDGSNNSGWIFWFSRFVSNITLTEFTIQNCEYGVVIEGDIWYDPYGNTIFHNIIRYNWCGIVILGSDNNHIYWNNITDNLGGISAGSIESDTSKNIIYQNIIMNNRQGISLQYMLSHNTNNNLIFQNNFINNLRNAYDSGSGNHWNNGSIGNYWDHWIGLRFNHPIFKLFPKVIFGIIGIDFDWHPAKEPYDIEV